MKKINIFLVILIFCCMGLIRTLHADNEIAQDFTLDSLDKTKVSLSDFKNKSMVLAVFWATWCPFCVEEIPELNKMANEYKEKVEILGINIKEASKKVSDFSKKKGIKYTILFDTKGETAQKYKVVGIPMNVLIDKDGKILYSGHSLEECKKSIK